MPTKRTRLTTEIKKKFSDMACELSPENLCCDGEASQANVKDRFEKIMTRWHGLEDQIGMKVNDEIINQWEEEKSTETICCDLCGHEYDRHIGDECPNCGNNNHDLFVEKFGD